MADKFIKWYRARSARDGFLAQAEFLDANGIRIRNPATGKGVMLDVDGSGVSVEPEEMAPGTFGYVLDLDGDTAEYDWDDFFDAIHMDNFRPVEIYPDLLVVKGPLAREGRLLNTPSFVGVRELGQGLIEFTNFFKGAHSSGDR